MDIQRIASLQRKYLQSPEWEAFKKEYENIMKNQSKIKISSNGEISYNNIIVEFPKYINLNNKMSELLSKMKNILVNIDDELQRATLEESESLKSVFEIKKLEYIKFLEEYNAFKKVIDDEEEKLIKKNIEYAQMYNQYYKLYYKRQQTYKQFKIIMNLKTTKTLFKIYNKEKVLTEKRAKQISKNIGLNGENDDILEIMNRWKYFQICEQYKNLQKNIKDLVKDIIMLTKDKNYLINNFILEFPKIRRTQVKEKEQIGGAISPEYKHITMPSYMNTENFSNYFMEGGGEEHFNEDEHNEDEHNEDEHNEDEYNEDEHNEDEYNEDEYNEDEHNEDKTQLDGGLQIGENVININLAQKQIIPDIVEPEQNGGGDINFGGIAPPLNPKLVKQNPILKNITTVGETQNHRVININI
jgi:hypothetical protein